MSNIPQDHDQTVLDTRSAYETPEGINLELRIAGPVVRACAWVIDMAIRAAIYIGLGITLEFAGDFGSGVFFITVFLLEWFYPVFFEVRSGSSPGKNAMGLRVIHDNGTPISFSSSLIRNLLRTADFLPFFYGFGLAAMMSNKRFQRLGDMAAGTLVVYADRTQARAPFVKVPPSPPPMQLNVDEQSQFVEFAERSTQLSVERQAELASILVDITGKQGQEAADALLAYANWLARGR